MGQWWDLSVDGFVTYQTAKRVKIRDARLAFFFFFMVGAGLLYIAVYSILYRNILFVKYEVSGEADLTIQQPTYHGCNPRDAGCKNDFRPLTELPYCRQSAGAHGHGEGKALCKFEEPHHFNPAIVPGSLFVPTRVDYFDMDMGCNPTKANGFACQESWLMTNRTTTLLADIERYTLRLSHSWSVFTDGVMDSGTMSRSGGYLYKCEDREKEFSTPVEVKRICPSGFSREPIECLVGDCNGDLPNPPLLVPDEDKGARLGRIAKGGIFAIPSGDIFNLNALLALAGLDLDKTLNSDNETLREAGTVLMVDAVYSNMRPWWSLWDRLHGRAEYTYTYHVQQRPAKEFKQERMARNSEDVIIDSHGILILLTVRGFYGVLCFSRLLIVVTSMLGIVALAKFVADYIAMRMETVPTHQVVAAHHMFDEVHVRGASKSTGERSLSTMESGQACDDGNDDMAKTPFIKVATFQEDAILESPGCFGRRPW